MLRLLLAAIVALDFGVHAHDALVAKGDVLEAATDRVQKNSCAEPATLYPIRR